MKLSPHSHVYCSASTYRRASSRESLYSTFALSYACMYMCTCQEKFQEAVRHENGVRPALFLRLVICIEIIRRQQGSAAGQAEITVTGIGEGERVFLSILIKIHAKAHIHVPRSCLQQLEDARVCSLTCCEGSFRIDSLRLRLRICRARIAANAAIWLVAAAVAVYYTYFWSNYFKNTKQRSDPNFSSSPRVSLKM